MATNDNYIGVAMGLDVSDLKAGISEANKQIQLANSEFKRASSGMEDWTKSTEGLKAKVSQLSTVLDMQKRKLNGLQAEYDQVVATQGESSEQARRLKVQLNNQASVVNKTERELSNYEQTLKDAEEGNIDLSQSSLRAGKAISKMGDSASESGSKLEGLKRVAGGIGKVIAGLGASVVALGGAFLATASSTREFRTDMAKLETGFTEAGFSAKDATDTYTTLYGVLGDQGKATEASAHLAQLTNNQEELAQWTDIATGVYATFGDSLPIENLTEASNETAKTGKITGGLADALNWAGVSEEEFQAKLDNATTEQERQALITETLNGLYAESADKFKELNKDVIEAQKADAKLSQAMAELGAVAEPILTTLKNLVSDLLNAMLPLVKVFGEGLQGALNGVEGSAEKMAEGLGGLLDGLLSKLTEMLPVILDTALQIIPMLITSLLGALPQLLDVIIQLVNGIITMVATSLPQIVAKIMEILPMLINQLVASIPMLLEACIQLLMAIVQAIPVIVVALVNALPTIIDTIINTLISSIPILIDGAIKLFMAILDAIPVIVKALTKNLPKIINTIVQGLIKGIPAIIQGAIQLFMAILKAIPKIITELVRSMPQIISSIVTGLLQGVGELFKVGVELFNGLWDGLKSVWDNIVNWVSNAWEGFVDGFKNFFGIKSPSKLMKKMGSFLGEGLGDGITASIKDVKRDINGFNDFVSNNLGNVKTGLSLNNGSLRGGASQVVNAGLTINYNGQLNRKQVRKLEDDYYRSVKLRLKSEGAI